MIWQNPNDETEYQLASELQSNMALNSGNVITGSLIPAPGPDGGMFFDMACETAMTSMGETAPLSAYLFGGNEISGGR